MVVLFLMGFIGFFLGRRKLLGATNNGTIRPHSMPAYHGSYVAIWCALPSAIVLLFWIIFEDRILEALLVSYLGPDLSSLSNDLFDLMINDIKNVASGYISGSEIDPTILPAAERYISMRFTARLALLGGGIALAIAGLAWSWNHISVSFRARHSIEHVLRWTLILASLVAVVTTVGIILSVLFESIRFFSIVSVGQFLFGLEWSPQTAIRSDQVGSSGAFGAVPLFTGTLLITLIAMIVALPIGLLSAIYMAEFASDKIRNIIKNK